MAVLQLENMQEAREICGKKIKLSKKKEKKAILISQELRIARALAGNDKVIRDRALKSLKKWFHHRSQNLPFTEQDFLRLWKGLFYSMWMSDKPLIQEECAENISSLLHDLPIEHSLKFFKCGLISLMNEWFGIDQLRLDKFMMFVRRFLRQALVSLKKQDFAKETIIHFGNILSSTILNPEQRDSMGLFMHFTEIYMEELAKVTEGKLIPTMVTSFLMPFIKCIAVAEDARISHIKKFIFNYLINQSDEGLEYQQKYNAWKKAGFPGTIHSMHKVEICDDDGVSSEEDDHLSYTSETKPLDPRAGRVDVELPQIKFQPEAIAAALLEHKHMENSSVAARKTIKLLARQFNTLARGSYPLGVTSLKLPKSEFKDMRLKKAVNRLVKFEKKLMGHKRRALKRKLIESEDESSIKKTKLKKKISLEKESKEQPAKEVFPKNPWDQPLQEGEYEMCIPTKSYVQKLKKISRKSSANVQELINNKLGKSRHSLDFKRDLLSSTPQSAKRVKINTKLNQSQEFHEYHSQVLCSPNIIFDANKKPGKPLLKTPTINSPVNPFYRKS